MKIVTDSAADLPGDIARQMDIAVVPIRVNIGRNTFRDGVDAIPGDFPGGTEYPTTSQPSPLDFQQAFEALLGQGHDVLCLTLSSILSGTYLSASIAAMQTGGRVRIVDSQLVSAGLGILALRTAAFAAEEGNLDRTAAFAEEEKKRIRTYAVLDNIEPIVRGGRMNLFARHAADREGIKLLLTLNDNGGVQILERVRGRRRSLDRLVELMVGPREFAVVHVDSIGEAGRVAEQIALQYRAEALFVREAGNTVSTYAGRGAVIVAG